MSQQPIHVGVGVDLSAGNILTAFYATVSLAAGSVVVLSQEHVISTTAALLAGMVITLVVQFLGTLLGKSTAPNAFADEVNQLRAEAEALRAQAAAASAPPEQQAPMLPSKLTIEYPDGSEHEVPLT